ncbi:hypothetical protein ABZS88_11300 [Streptomyces sp. NPDC005480]|uniref:hypothetical protein n=1 Tax=Streptomyces sp. NPDC005480 TaxID=3154880 RepID=UPI0033B38D6C
MNVDDIVAAKIAAARARAEATARRRATLNAARQRGLAARHAAKLRNLRGAEDHAAMGEQPTTAGQPPTVATPAVTDTVTDDTEESQ